jgi:hypothetical protein
MWQNRKGMINAAMVSTTDITGALITYVSACVRACNQVRAYRSRTVVIC